MCTATKIYFEKITETHENTQHIHNNNNKIIIIINQTALTRSFENFISALISRTINTLFIPIRLLKFSIGMGLK